MGSVDDKTAESLMHGDDRQRKVSDARRESVVRRESVSASTANLNWSGGQAHAGRVFGSSELQTVTDDTGIPSPKVLRYIYVLNDQMTAVIICEL